MSSWEPVRNRILRRLQDSSNDSVREAVKMVFKLLDKTKKTVEIDDEDMHEAVGGPKVTIYSTGVVGAIVKSEGVLTKITKGGVSYIPKKARKERMIMGYYSPFWMVVEGWGHPDPGDMWDPEKTSTGGGVTVQTAKYMGHDPRWRGDFMDAVGNKLASKVIAVYQDRTLRIEKPNLVPQVATESVRDLARALEEAGQSILAPGPKTSGDSHADAFCKQLQAEVAGAVAGKHFRCYVDTRFGGGTVFIKYANVPAGSPGLDIDNAKPTILMSVGPYAQDGSVKGAKLTLKVVSGHGVKVRGKTGTPSQILKHAAAAVKQIAALEEAQKATPAMAFPDEDAPTRKGAFKISSKALRLFKKEVEIDNPAKMLFLSQRKVLDDIPRDDLPKLFGKTNMADAQDVVSHRPRKAFQMFMRNAHKVSPKLHKMLQGVPDNASMYFYGIMLRVVGKDMADIVLKRYFETESDHPGTLNKKQEKQESVRSLSGSLREGLSVRASKYRGREGFSVSGRARKGDPFPTSIFVHTREAAEKIRDLLKTRNYDNWDSVSDELDKIIRGEKK